MADKPLREPGAEWQITSQAADGDTAGVPLAGFSHRRGAQPRPATQSWRPVPMSAIRALVQRIVQRFHPEKVILFGSYAYGRPRPESDVDLLVIMETPLRARQQRLEISRTLSPRPFPLDIIVHTPQEVSRRLALGDAFLDEIITRGKVLYERTRS